MGASRPQRYLRPPSQVGRCGTSARVPKHTLPIVLYTFLNIVLTTVHGRMVGGVMERGLVADGREGMVAGVGSSGRVRLTMFELDGGYSLRLITC